MQSKHANEAIPAPPQTIAEDVTRFAECVASRAQNVAAAVHAKLHPVMLGDLPREGREYAVASDYPPLFEELHKSLIEIDASLDYIENAMSRTAL